MTAPVDEGQAPGPFAPLGEPNFRRYFAGQVVSNVGTWFQVLAQALLVVELAGTGTALGVVVALQWLPTLALGSVAGAVVDRREPRVVLLATNTVAGALAVVLTGVTATGHVTTQWLYGLSLALGLVLAFDRPAAQIVPVELVPGPLVPRALGINSMIQSASRLVGPAVAGLAYAAWGPAWCFGINAASYGAAVAVLAALDRGALHPRPRPAAARGQVRAGLAYVARHRAVRSVLVANAVVGLLAVNFLVVITAAVQLTFGGGELAVGVAHGANAAGALVGGVVVGGALARLSRRVDRVCLALGAALAVNALAPTLPAFVLAGPALGLAWIAYQTTVLDVCRRLVPPEMLGRVVGLVALGTFGTTPFGSVIVGAVIDAASPRAALALGAAACVAAAVVVRPALVPLQGTDHMTSDR
ncbi:MAG TPA: MFS transporter [Acidimicrobiales bacterium]|nr:MFS transporter [Acidimicrobiales bacterium]